MSVCVSAMASENYSMYEAENIIKDNSKSLLMQLRLRF